MDRPKKVLVTGATGFLGGRVAHRLVELGYEVRALVRKQSVMNSLKNLGVEIVLGDLADQSSVAAAVDGVELVVHAGAGTSGTAEDSDKATIQGTLNVLAGCRKHRVQKLVHISSCNVYETAGLAEGQVVTEEAQLERFPQRRGRYTAAKLRAEALVIEAMKAGALPAVVLRPGTLYGPGAETYTPMMGVSLAGRLFIVFGNGSSALPLVHVDNVVDAITGCLGNSAADNQVFNVVDHGTITKRRYVEMLVKPLHPSASVIYLPMPLLLCLTWLEEKLLTALGRRPPLTVYRLLSSQSQVRYGTSRIEAAIGWRSRVSFEQGTGQLLRTHERA